MINYNSNYIYLTVPTEYKCVYYNILDVLGNLGRDLLSACTATCKGRAINGIACYNMFNAACAAYYLGQVKLARTLISYIKAQLEISCDNLLIFQDSSLDEFVYLKVPVTYQVLFENILSKMTVWGQELLDDCTASCSGNNKNILNAWNLFQAAITAYEYGNSNQANKIVNFISTSLGISNDVPGEDIPTTTYYTIAVNVSPSNAIVTINGVQTKTITVEKNKLVSIIVSCPGYETYTYSFNAERPETINVSLHPSTPQEDNNVTIEVVPVPSDATVKINGNTGNILSVLKGTPVNITVSKTGYITEVVPQFIAQESVKKTVRLNPQEEEQTTATISINPTPSDAIVKINGIVRSAATLEKGTSCTYEVSKQGYKTVRDTFTVDNDRVLTPVLKASNFSVTPTSVALAYTGGKVQFFAYENVQDGQLLMINDNRNPTELIYYNENTDEPIQQDSLHGIDVPYFYTYVPENTTNQTQTYRITAKNLADVGNDNETIDIVITVAPNSGTPGMSVITLDVAKDAYRNVLTGCRYYHDGFLILNPPTAQKSYTIEFETNPSSQKGTTIVVEKEGYRDAIYNIDFKNGSQTISPILEIEGDAEDLYVVPLKYYSFSPNALYDYQNYKYNLIKYMDENERELRTAFVVRCQSYNDDSEAVVNIVADGNINQGIDVFNATNQGDGEIIIIINPYIWNNREIEVVISNNSNSESYTLKTPAV